MKSSRRPARPAGKRADRYHHGDLRRALLHETVRTIQAHGVERVTLRAVGQALGVSRTALYRHFADKAALLEAVAGEGFRLLRLDTAAAWEKCQGGREGFEAMGVAYVHFALTHPSHYRVMFGGLVDRGAANHELMDEAAAAFQVLVDAIVAQQHAGLVRPDDPVTVARYIWATVHGIAMLGIDGQLRAEQGGAEALIHYANQRLRSGMAADTPGAS